MSVVIPTYQRRSFLPDVLDPLLEDPATSEVIVVVDGSNDGSYEYLQARATATGRLRPLWTPNRGQSSAQQIGAEHATGDVLLFLDDDVVPAPGLVTGHAHRHRDGSDLVVVGHMPVTLSVAAHDADWVLLRYAYRYRRMTERWQEDSDNILRHLWGGNVSIRRVHLRRVPMHRPGVQLSYHIDWELGLRCRQAGLRGVFDPDLLADHRYTRTVPQFLRDRAASAADRALIHQLHADDIGPLPHDYFWHGASTRQLRVLRLIRLLPTGMTERLLASMITAVGRLRLHTVEAIACDYLDRLQGHRIAGSQVRLTAARQREGPDEHYANNDDLKGPEGTGDLPM